jgi:hypothetical protein
MGLACAWCGQQKKDWMTTGEAAEFLGVKKRSFTRACREGLVPGAELVRRSVHERGSTESLPLLCQPLRVRHRRLTLRLS